MLQLLLCYASVTAATAGIGFYVGWWAEQIPKPFDSICAIANLAVAGLATVFIEALFFGHGELSGLSWLKCIGPFFVGYLLGTFFGDDDGQWRSWVKTKTSAAKRTLLAKVRAYVPTPEQKPQPA